MLDHVTIGVTDVERSKSFYDQALGPLGIRPPAHRGWNIRRLRLPR